ncbi:Gfo/Idh/MocA family oxidoreductase [bacterium]|nr:Gfo/Idh/MocA family oxidoreductase [bacterium]
MSRRVTRRRALAAAGYLAAAPAFSLNRVWGANDRIRVAGIGVGGKGSSDIEHAGRVMDVVALCDIDDQRLEQRARTWPSAQKFFDYRTLFERMARDIDAVVVSTADHSHAPASMMAMRLGKHVYCQKPLTHTIEEARLMREAAARYKVCTQMGNQGSALNGLRRAVELVRGGAIGNVAEVHVWTNRPAQYWKQSPDITARPMEAPVPKHVHWEEWIGPAAMRPYAVAFAPRPAYHPHDWRGYWEFGTGALGDMACHTANMPFRALNLDAPTAVVADAAEINTETFPAWGHIQYKFPARGTLPACTLHWYEGKRGNSRVLPPGDLIGRLNLRPGEQLPASGSILVGDKGILFSPSDYGNLFRIVPETIVEGRQLTRPETLPAGAESDQGGAHDAYQKAEWARAIRENRPEIATSNFDYAGRLTEAMLLGNIAVRFAGTELRWDAAKLTFTNNEAASRLVRKEYRRGWDLVRG